MKSKTWTKWTPYEDSVLRSHVKKHPENLQYCFFLASKELNRTHKSVAMRWYQYLRNQKKTGIVFTLFSKVKNLINIKNQRKDYGK